MTYDIAIVGAGIVGLAHAYAAARAGLKVVVLDRETRSIGASVRNFGFITVTGQRAGETWARARRSRDVWAQVAEAAAIPIVQRGLTVVARRPEAAAVLHAFAATEMGADCTLLSAADTAARLPMLKARAADVLWSPHDLRIEAREAMARLTTWLSQAWGVEVIRPAHVAAVDLPEIWTSLGRLRAQACVICPGDDLYTLFADRIRAHTVTRTKLQMLRLRAPSWRLAAPVMSDLSLVRYHGYAALPEAAALRARLEQECTAELAHGIHLILAQSADGTLMVGDSHHEDPAPDPVSSEAVDRLILQDAAAVLDLEDATPVERWTGTYAKAPAGDFLVEAPTDHLRLVMVTTGAGMSTAFALAEDVIGGLMGRTIPA